MTPDALLGYVHPTLMVLVFLPALYAVWSGIQRARCLHFHVKTQFPWKRHVRLGTLAAALWILGAPSGLIGAQTAFGMTFVSGMHAIVGCVASVLALFALGSGMLLPRVKKHRRALAAAHGINNCALVVLAVWQIVDGIELVQLL